MTGFSFDFQVPLPIPVLVLLASLYLVVAPFYEAPLESFLCLLFILAGVPMYLLFVYFNLLPKCLHDRFGKPTIGYPLASSRFSDSGKEEK